MRDGKLLAMDSPSALKQHALPGLTWDVFASPLLPALSALEHCPCVIRAGLASDHLRAITPTGIESDTLVKTLRDAGIQVQRVERAEPTLEDVFLALAQVNVKPSTSIS
jgi:ABC-2 type transport system ATP-binding protein